MSQTPRILSPRVRSCLKPRSPDKSAAPVIPTRIKSACTTATWISSGSTLPSALFPMGCRATEDLSEADVPLTDNRLDASRQRRLAAFVPRSVQTLNATIFVCQAPCRISRSRASTETPASDDSLTPLHLLLLFLGEWTLPSSLAPFAPRLASCLHRYIQSREELWSRTLPTFLSITSLGASSIRQSGFKSSSENSIQIPGGYPPFFFIPSCEEHLSKLIKPTLCILSWF